MKKFSDKLNESKIEFDPEQLEMGIKIESEHCDIYEQLEAYLKQFSNKLPMPWTRKEFYKRIAQAHLREMSDYYTRLQKMESDK